MTRTFCALAVLLLGTGPALAGNGFDYAPPVAPAPPDLGGLVVRLGLITAALVGLCLTVLWFARRANRPAGGTGIGDGDGRLRLEGTLALDRTCGVHLISVDGQTVALTTDGTGLRSLVVLSEPFDTTLAAAQQADPAAPAAEPEPAAGAPPAPKWSADDVRQLLQRVVRRADGPGVHLEPALGHDQP
ncbi:MAG TPA: hypothetical protein VGE74_02490 [Gemmata sp.]